MEGRSKLLPISLGTSPFKTLLFLMVPVFVSASFTYILDNLKHKTFLLRADLELVLCSNFLTTINASKRLGHISRTHWIKKMHFLQFKFLCTLE